MATYPVKYGETFGDVVLNSTGVIANWSAILDANNFGEWTPTLTAGQLLAIPDNLPVDNDAINQLAIYPACNHSVSNVYAQISAIFTIIAGADPATSPGNGAAQDTNKYYMVRYGETITDVVLNSTGNNANWELILNANGFSEWVPILTAGQKIIIPVTVVNDQNVQRQLNVYPANNASVNDVYDKINVVFGILNDNWILTTGFWNDTAIWKDTKNWIDAL